MKTVCLVAGYDYSGVGHAREMKKSDPNAKTIDRTLRCATAPQRR